MSSPLPLGPSSALRSAKTVQARKDILNSYYEEGFHYSKSLIGHKSCVNALAFSCGNGQYMASAGDDLIVRLWDLHREDIKVASAFSGARGNIFSLAFSASNKYLYSGGVDCKVFRYTLDEDGAGSDAVWTHHDEDVRAVTAHPYSDDVALSCGEDGRVILYDSRADFSRAQATLQLMSEVTCVQYNPRMDHVFVTSDAAGKVCLRDARMAFGPSSLRSQHGVVHTYATTLQKPSGAHAKPTVSSVVFDADGKASPLLSLTWSYTHFYPTIYGMTDTGPLAICTGKFFPDGNPPPDGERTYCNDATIKACLSHSSSPHVSPLQHGSFGGPDGTYYAAGSDDFRGYVWQIPPLRELQEQRQVLNEAEWRAREIGQVADSAQGDYKARYLPVQLNRPEFQLRGHQSIVNTALAHPHLPLIATAGIESHIMLHSPTPGVPFSQEPLGLTRLDTRRLPHPSRADRDAIRRILIGIVPPTEDEDDFSDQTTINLFDEILRTEGGDDNDGVFDTGLSWMSDDSESDEIEDEGMMSVDEG
ncbi:WD40 repeat-like protein [Peniophora sp. CONT]|nr:WD40 repeat-like protein [Peniophora sp. CONT]